MREGMRVVEVGGGRGDFALRLLRHGGVGRLVGVNYSATETAAARERLARAGLGGRAELNCGDAARLLRFVGEGEADAVVALDCAYHFATRARFLDAAGRALGEGGWLASADVLAARRGGWIEEGLLLLAARCLGIPPANLVSQSELRAQLRGGGFGNVELRDVTEEVLRGFSAFLWRAAFRGRLLHAPLRVALSLAFALIAWTGRLRYVLYAAQKERVGR